MIDPNEIVEFNGQLVAIKDIPSAQIRALYGLGHLPEPGREVIPNPTGEAWPYRPEDCPRAAEMTGTWINDGQYLVCPGCGMDGT
ncbi:hypothetical protein ACFW2V_12410 [Streptomyces sp. NPDC058947]|uniref:hypothetical protein n=1 Tax=Streptomyces sp. NPDC058947 TaxID=3346675 RepID=UPI0036917FC7